MYKQIINNGSEEFLSKAEIALQNLRISDKDFLHVITRDIADIKYISDKISSKFNRLILIGTGGSSLGAKALISALSNSALSNNDNEFSVLDNADPSTVDKVISEITATTAFLIISKSGKTLEILANFSIMLQYAKLEQFFVITEDNSSPLREMSERFGIDVISHPSNIGGRYSVLSLVALIPAFYMGVDISALQNGARKVQATIEKDVVNCPPAIGAAWQAKNFSKNIHVLMAYADSMRNFGLWWQQLIAESLGKNGGGITPLPALGAVDQHSILQLFLDGDNDKFFSFITLDNENKGAISPYLKNKKIGDLMFAMQKATVSNIAKKHPSRQFLIDEINAENIGALLQHFMIETVLTADILGINPYDQPSVEQGKILAREYLGL